MQPQIEQLRQEAEERIQFVADASQLEEFRVTYLARKGRIAALFEQLKNVPAEQKPALGKSLNELRTHVLQLHDKRAAAFATVKAARDLERKRLVIARNLVE